MKPKTLPQQLKKTVDSYRKARRDRHRTEERIKKYSEDIRYKGYVEVLQKLRQESYVREEDFRIQVINVADEARRRQEISDIKYWGIMKEYA